MSYVTVSISGEINLWQASANFCLGTIGLDSAHYNREIKDKFILVLQIYIHILLCYFLFSNNNIFSHWLLSAYSKSRVFQHSDPLV